jgi:hypothetical protein
VSIRDFLESEFDKTGHRRRFEADRASLNRRLTVPSNQFPILRHPQAYRVDEILDKRV